MVDPRWEAPQGARLQIEVYTEAQNQLGFELHFDAWRNYSGRRSRSYTALASLDKPGWHTVTLSPGDFVDSKGEKAVDWFGITEFGVCSGKRLKARKVTESWQGTPAKFRNLKWIGGTYEPRVKAYLPSGKKAGSSGYNDEFQDAIDRSVEQEQLDKAQLAK